MRRRLAGGCLAVAALATAGRARAQVAPGPRPALAGGESPGRHETVLPEVRLDGFAGRRAGAQIAGGVVVDAGFYARLALLAGGGLERAPGGALIGTQRAEAVLRFLTDPLRKSSPGVYLGGGLGAWHANGDRTRATLVAVVGFEGPYTHHAAPAIEVGVGGGVRLGVALRRARLDER